MMFEHYEKMNKLHANGNQTISSSYFVKNFVEFDTITFLIKKDHLKNCLIHDLLEGANIIYMHVHITLIKNIYIESLKIYMYLSCKHFYNVSICYFQLLYELESM